MSTNPEPPESGPLVTQPPQMPELRTKWTPEDDRALITAYAKQRALQPNRLNGCNDSFWKPIAQELAGTEEENHKPKNASSCRSRFNVLKRAYLEVKLLLGLNGARWDHQKQLVTLLDEQWQTLEDSNFLKYRHRSFPLYDAMEAVVGDKSVTDLGQDPIADSAEGSQSDRGQNQPDNDFGQSGETDRNSVETRSIKRRRSTQEPGNEFPRQIRGSIPAFSLNRASISNQSSQLTRAIKVLQQDPSLTYSDILGASREFGLNRDLAEVYLALHEDLRAAWVQGYLLRDRTI